MEHRIGVCEHCHARWSIPSTFTSRKARCRVSLGAGTVCGGTVVIGPVEELRPPEEHDLQDEPTAAYAEPRERSSSSLPSRRGRSRRGPRAGASGQQARPATPAPLDETTSFDEEPLFDGAGGWDEANVSAGSAPTADTSRGTEGSNEDTSGGRRGRRGRGGRHRRRRGGANGPS